jgi:hypothetical protein
MQVCSLRPVIDWVTPSFYFALAIDDAATLRLMALSLYIVVEGEDPGYDIFVNGHALARNDEALERLAEGLNVNPLRAFLFADQPAMAVVLENGTEEPELPLLLPTSQWFDPADGLLTVRTLLRFLDVVPAALGSETPAVFLELREYERVLRKTVERGLRWHVECSGE